MKYFCFFMTTLFVFSLPLRGQSSLIVNIDNPNFRKLVVAIPEFNTPDGADAELKALGRKGAEDLGHLLTFSGLFNVMGSAAYQDIQIKKAPSQTAQGMEGIDLAQWKAIGVESLTVANLEREGSTLTIALRTADIYQGKLALGKRYTKVAPSEFNLVIRRYADHLLQAYTGKKGIFSSKLVFIGKASKGAFKQVYISDFDGSNVKQITDTKAPHLSPAFSTDGRFVTYTSFEDGNPDLFIYELATGKRRKLSGRKGLNSGSNWSHNGKLIAFTGSVNGDADIYTTTPDGSKVAPLIRGNGLDVDPTFSPDGQWMAFVSGRFGNPHIFLATLKWEGDTTVRVTGDKRLTYAGWYNATPAWSPDSDKLVFAGYDKDINRFDMFIMKPDGTQLERLTLRSGDNERPSWSPNGQMIVFQSSRNGTADVKGNPHLYVMNRDGSGQRILNTGLYEAQQPCWGPAME
jgi:TolB protein